MCDRHIANVLLRVYHPAQVVVAFGVPFTPDFVNLAGGNIARVFAAFPWDLLVKVRLAAFP